MSASPRLLEVLRKKFGDVPPELRKARIREYVTALDDFEAEEFLYDWAGTWARDGQLEPEGTWLFWLILAGRGYGKTRVGAETIRKWGTVDMPGSRLFIAARTMDDAKKTCVEGESGLLACLPARFQPPFGGHWNRSSGELWLGPARESATYVKLFTSEKPDAGRGYQSHGGWADELASWVKAGELWDQLLLGLRLPWPKRLARAVVSTTPKPVPVLRELLDNPDTVVSKGTTYENLENLSPAFKSIIRKFEGTRVGRQELNAELLDDTPGALWTRTLLEDLRVKFPPLRTGKDGEEFDLVRIVVAIDPSASSGEGAAEAGVMIGGVGANRHRYLLEDASPDGPCKPVVWATAAVRAYHHYKADCIVAEANNGGEMITAVVKSVDPTVRTRLVYASRGKHTRAEPIATAYETGDIHHVGAFELLEDQLCTWVPGGKSPDRLDALVWLMTELEGRRLVL